MSDNPTTFYEILPVIEAFNDEYPNAQWYLAHIVLSDYNLANEHIDYCLETCFKKEYWGQFIANIDEDEIEETRNLLAWLKTLPENIREIPDDYE